jgi:hypothetical protein
MNSSITHVRLSALETQRIIEERLLPALEGEPVDYSLMAIFTLAAMLMKPEISSEELAASVHDMSQHLSLSLMDMEDFGTPQ